MSALNNLKITFFEESNELLVQLEQALNEMQDGSGSEDTVHAIFRAVHSIKGGAGVFGFGELIEFAHVFETVMDAIRSDKLAPTPDVLDVLFRSNDVRWPISSAWRARARRSSRALAANAARHWSA